MGRHLLRRLLAIGVLAAVSAGLGAGPLPDRQGMASPSLKAPGPSPDLLVPAYPSLLAPTRLLFDGCDHPQVQEEIRSILGRKEWFSWVLQKSGAFRSVIIPQLDRNRLPRELFYLVLVESEFNPSALSRSGAAGLWQFMPASTPPQLAMDIWQDRRFDFQASGNAAGAKLRDNHALTGSWTLAVAAYNGGLGRVRRAQLDTGSSDWWSPAFQDRMSEETRRYVPRILASAWLGSRAGRTGIRLGWLPRVEWDTVVFDGPVALQDVADALGLPLRTVLAWNPEYRFEVTAPRPGGHEVRLPRECADDLL